MNHRLFSATSFAFLSAVLTMASCAKQQQPPPTAPEPPAEAEAEAPVSPTADVPWSEKDKQQRKAYMKDVVLPEMTAKFQDFDLERFDKVNCQTCHGENMVEVDFEMPNAVTPLPAEDTIEAAKEFDPEMTAFMVEDVVPTMAELLDTQPFDPETGEGFGCFNCHLKE